MRYWIAAGLILGGLITLLGLQYQWLRAGLFLEKQFLEHRYQRALDSTVARLEQSPNTIDLLPAISREARNLTPEQESRLQDSLQQWLGLSSAAFAFRQSSTAPPLWASPGFDPSAVGWTYHKALIGHAVQSRCFCSMELAVQPVHPIRQLLSELSTELWVGGLSCMLILSGAWLLFLGVRRLQQLDRAKTNFIDHLTHELKTPIFSNQLFLRLGMEAIQQRQDSQALQHLQHARTQNRRLLTVTERLLELARQDRPSLPLRWEEVDLVQLIGEIRPEVAERALTEEAQVEWCLEPEAAWIVGDAHHLRQSLFNLLDNAFKYQGSSPHIRVLLTEKANWWVIGVADRGPGVPRAHRRAIFRKYARMPSAAHRPGYGLGLHYVRTVIRAQGGRVRVHARPGGGAVFSLFLPK